MGSRNERGLMTPFSEEKSPRRKVAQFLYASPRLSGSTGYQGDVLVDPRMDKLEAETRAGKVEARDKLRERALQWLTSGNLKGAVAAALESIHIMEKGLGSLGEILPECMVLTRAYFHLGDDAEARFYLNRCDKLVHMEPYDDPATNASLYSMLAELHMLNNDTARAKSIYCKYLKQMEEIFGTNHIATSDCYNVLAAFFTHQGEYGIAIDYCTKALVIRMEQLGMNHQHTADSHYNLGLLYRLFGRPVDARREFGVARDIRKAIFGVDSLEVAEVELSMGFTEHQMGKLLAAHDLCERAYLVRRASLGRRHPDTLEALNLLDTVRIAQGAARFEESSLQSPKKSSKSNSVKARHETRFDGYTVERVLERLSRSDRATPGFVARVRKAIVSNGPCTVHEIKERFLSRYPMETSNLIEELFDQELEQKIHPTGSSSRSVGTSSQSQVNLGQRRSGGTHGTGLQSDGTPVPFPISPLVSNGQTKTFFEDPHRRPSTSSGHSRTKSTETHALNPKPSSARGRQGDSVSSLSGDQFSWHRDVVERYGVKSASKAPSTNANIQMSDQAVPRANETDFGYPFQMSWMAAMTEKERQLLEEQDTVRYGLGSPSNSRLHDMQPAGDQSQAHNTSGRSGPFSGSGEGDGSFTGNGGSNFGRNTGSQLNGASTSQSNAFDYSFFDNYPIRPSSQRNMNGAMGASTGMGTPIDGDHHEGGHMTTSHGGGYDGTGMGGIGRGGPSSGGSGRGEGGFTNDSDVINTVGGYGSGFGYGYDDGFGSADKSGHGPRHDKEKQNSKGHGFGNGNGYGDGDGASKSNGDRPQSGADDFPSAYLGMTSSNSKLTVVRNESSMNENEGDSPNSSLRNIIGGNAVPGGRRMKVVELSGEELWKSFDAQILCGFGLLPMLLHEKRELDRLEAEKNREVPPTPDEPPPPAAQEKQDIPAPAPPPIAKPPKVVPKGPKSDTKRLHWDVLEDTEGTLWDSGVDSSDIELTDLASEFSAKQAKKKIPDQAEEKPAKRQEVSLIPDPKRRQNMSIFAKTLMKGGRELSDVGNAIRQMEVSKFGPNALESLKEFLPESEETDAVTSYIESEGDETLLGPAERFVLALSDVPRLQQRIQTLSVLAQFDEHIEEVEARMEVVVKTCNQIRESQRFVQLLQIILKVGNELNKGTHKGDAQGIRLSSLIKLTQTKSNNNVTVLDFLVDYLDTNQPELLDVSDDFPLLSEASRLSMQLLAADEAKVKSGVNFVLGVKKTAEKVGDDPDFVRVSHDFLHQALLRVKRMEDAFKAMNETLQDLCKYIGEQSSSAAPEEHFQHLQNFLTTLNTAVKKSREARERKERRERHEMMKRKG